MRRLKNPPSSSVSDRQTSLLEFVAPDDKGKGKAGKKPRAMTLRAFKSLIVETEDLKKRKEWNQFTPKHFVGMYCLLHHHVYGVFPYEVRDNYDNAVRAARRMLNSEFDQDNERMLKFMIWLWRREDRREKKRDDDNSFRIGWRLQFGRTLMVDYRVSSNRNRRRRR